MAEKVVIKPIEYNSIWCLFKSFFYRFFRTTYTNRVNVKHYGAICDGVCDDTEAILRALEKARGVSPMRWEFEGFKYSSKKSHYSWDPLATIYIPGMCRTTRPLLINHQRIAIIGGGIGRDSRGPGGIIADHPGPVIELDLTPIERDKKKGWVPRKFVLDGLHITHNKSFKGRFPEYDLRIEYVNKKKYESNDKVMREFENEYNSKNKNNDWRNTHDLTIFVVVLLWDDGTTVVKYDIAGYKKPKEEGNGEFERIPNTRKENVFNEEIPNLNEFQSHWKRECERRIIEVATRLLGFEPPRWPDGLSIRGERSWGPDDVYDTKDDIPAHWTRDLLIRNCSFDLHDRAVSITYDQGSFCAFHAEHSSFSHNILGIHSTAKLTNGHILACDITQNSFGGLKISASGFEITGCDFEGQPRPIEIVGFGGAIHLGPNYFEANHSGDALVRLRGVQNFFVASPHISGCSIPSVYAENCGSGRIESPTPVLHNCSDVECTKPMSWAGYLGRKSDPDKKNDYQSATIRPQSCSWNWANGKPTKDYSHVPKRIIIPLPSPVGTQQNHSSFSESVKKTNINKAVKNWSNGDDINILEGEQICAAISVKYMNTLATDPAMIVQGVYIHTDGHPHWDDEITLFGNPKFPGIVHGDTVTYFGSFECKKKYVGLRICIYPYKYTADKKEKIGYGARLSDAMVWLNTQLQKPEPPSILESREKLRIPYAGEPH